MIYKGRFAPSPSGPLHFGSLLAAVASYLQAKKNKGNWYVRIEDLDPPREVPGATGDILGTLELFGFEWDDEIIYQSRRSGLYRQYLQQLLDLKLAYPCSCSRSDIETMMPAESNQLVYQGTCRSGIAPGKKSHSIRVMTNRNVTSFNDSIQGTYKQTLETEVGDFVVQRADGLYSYQLAVVIDDYEQGITEVVRGYDLLDSTPRQIYLQTLLNINSPAYMHIPIAINNEGQKLSKQTNAPPLDKANPAPCIFMALDFLGQNPPAELQHEELKLLWEWAIINWDAADIPRSTSLAFPHQTKP